MRFMSAVSIVSSSQPHSGGYRSPGLPEVDAPILVIGDSSRMRRE
jgi:hypothetical protein